MKSLNVALVQQSCGEDKEANLHKSIEAIRRAAGMGSQLVVLQELHAGPYFCQSEDPRCFDLAEPIPGPTTERLGSVARECQVIIVASLFERRAPGLYHNTHYADTALKQIDPQLFKLQFIHVRCHAGIKAPHQGF